MPNDKPIAAEPESVEALLARVAAAPLDMLVPHYGALPAGPPETGLLAPTRDVGRLLPNLQPRFIALAIDINELVNPRGVTAKIIETERTDWRQVYLWGIGRFYQAAGRTGVVTKVRFAGAKHRERKAVDFGYFDLATGKQVGKAHYEPMLKANYELLEVKHNLRWGGRFNDTPHWEAP